MLPAPATADRWTCEHVLSIATDTDAASIRTTRYRGFRFAGALSDGSASLDNGTVWVPIRWPGVTTHPGALCRLVPAGAWGAGGRLRVGDLILSRNPDFFTLDPGWAPGRRTGLRIARELERAFRQMNWPIARHRRASMTFGGIPPGSAMCRSSRRGQRR